MVSDKPDPEKERILRYLKTHCIMVCPGVVYDEITPDRVIGFGDTFSDGTYYWKDVFVNYVERYNIPVPAEFRAHILSNYSNRMKRHTLLRVIDKLDVENCVAGKREYRATICKNGEVAYWNNSDMLTGTSVQILPDDAKYIINPVLAELFCYDSDIHGSAVVGGYHWKISFYSKGKLVDVVEGWPHEDKWRLTRAKQVIEFIEHYIPFSMGAQYMDSV